tara:strand:+ start:12015 stop:12938 length:924 start_codon:yes stop_codon:yes gene_type:complete
MKVYLSKLNESWVVDRFRNDWYQNNKDISTESIYKSDIIWIISPWVWKKISRRQLKKKKVVCSIYHIDFENFDDNERKDFYERDKFVDEYHVISLKTKTQLENLTQKKITSIPFWVDQNIFKHLENKKKLRQKYGFKEEEYLVGSFQRDTEGHDLKSPKLIKGPDVFLDIVKERYEDNKNLVVILTGKRRQYLIYKFNELDIPYRYFEMVDIYTINELYNILDLYLVTSRIEGGPQAILECAQTRTPLLSTNVGVAPEILHEESIYEVDNFKNAKVNIEYAYEKSMRYTIPEGMSMYRSMMELIYES